MAYVCAAYTVAQKLLGSCERCGRSKFCVHGYIADFIFDERKFVACVFELRDEVQEKRGFPRAREASEDRDWNFLVGGHSDLSVLLPFLVVAFLLVEISKSAEIVSNFLVSGRAGAGVVLRPVLR